MRPGHAKSLSDTTAIGGEKASAMKTQGHSARLMRRANRQKIRTNVGPRAFIIFVVAAAVLGAIAISMNMTLEDWERTHHSDYDDDR
jgi:hypothetical protein